MIEEKEMIKKGKLEHLETVVYAYYPAKKQAQDEKWVSSFTTKLKAMGFKNIEIKIVKSAGRFFEGESIDEIIQSVKIDQRVMFKKLLKVAVRTEWAERCVIEGKKAISEGRDANYPPFPKM